MNEMKIEVNEMHDMTGWWNCEMHEMDNEVHDMHEMVKWWNEWNEQWFEWNAWNDEMMKWLKCIMK